MRNFFSNQYFRNFNMKKTQILFLGLDYAGKDEILNKLINQKPTLTIPTVGFNVSTYEHDNLIIHQFDIGCADKVRILFRHFYQGTDAIVFVIDSSDHERIEENYEEIKKIMRETFLFNTIFLFFANKQDLPNAIKPEEIKKRLLDIKDHIWHVQGCSALTGEGIYEGLDWLGEQINQQF